VELEQLLNEIRETSTATSAQPDFMRILVFVSDSELQEFQHCPSNRGINFVQTSSGHTQMNPTPDEGRI